VIYCSAQAIYGRLGQAPLANPVLWSVVVLAWLLTISDTPYPTYFSGAQFIHFLLGPTVVALAWPMWERRKELRRRVVPLLLAALIGGVAAEGSAVAIA
jgi:putative effector of murein hydrolase